MELTQIAIYGAGGFALEVVWLIQSCNQAAKTYEVVCFIDDDSEKQGQLLKEIPILSLDGAYERFPSARVVRAMGNPKVSEIVMEKAAGKGFEFQTIIHPRVEKSEWVQIGSGTVICAGSIITTNVKIGNHVQINLDCTIGHDTIIDDFSTLAPGVHVSGWVHLRKRVYIGTGAVIINGTSKEPVVIGDDAVIGAGACVTKSVPSGLTVVGVPAKPIH